jgi:hypothetical protein
MTRDELLEKYGDLRLGFLSFKDFTFQFDGCARDYTTIIAYYGGSPAKLADFAFEDQDTRTLRTSMPFRVEVWQGNGLAADFYF